MFLVDTNVWLELLLEQDKADQTRRFFGDKEATVLFISDFSLFSIGIILTRLKKDNEFAEFLSDIIEDCGVGIIRLDPIGLKQIITVRQSFGLDFDDAYQYVAAEKHDLTLISFDGDFDRTPRGRRTPSEVSVER